MMSDAAAKAHIFEEKTIDVVNIRVPPKLRALDFGSQLHKKE